MSLRMKMADKTALVGSRGWAGRRWTIFRLVLGLVGALTLWAVLSPQLVRAQSPFTSETYREAYDAGFTDGLQAGQQDKERERHFDLANKKAFQTADRTFDAQRHNRDVYIVAYRRGFEDGYEQGYGLSGKKGAGQQVAVTSVSPSVVPATDRPAALSLKGKTVQVPAGTEIRIKLLDTLSTRRNARGDTFRAEVLEDVRLEGQTVIPRGARLHGRIGHLKRAGRIAGRAQMSLEFDRIEFADGTNFPIQASVASIEPRADKTIKDEEGTLEAPPERGEDLRRMGTSTGVGGLIGVIGGGKKGAGVGAAAGAVIGLASILSTRGRDIDLYSHTELTIRLNREAQITVP